MPNRVPSVKNRLKIAAAALCVVFYLLAAAVGGASLARLPLLLVCALLWLLLPGLTLARWLAPRGEGTAGQRLLWAIVYGCAFLVAVHCVAVRLHVLWLLRLIPPLLALPTLWHWWQGRADLRARRPRPDLDLILLWAVLLALFTVFIAARDPHPVAAGQAVLNQDMLWNIGNAAALQRAFPAEDIRFAGVRLSYHYLTELLWAALSLVSGAELFDVYMFFSAPLVLAAELCALRAVCSCLFGTEGRRRFFPLAGLLFGCGCASLWKPLENGESVFGNTMLRHLVTNVNAQATALVFFAAFLCAFAALARRRFAFEWRLFLALFAAFGLLCVAKGPMAAIVMCSLAVTVLLVLVLQRPHPLGALLCLAGVAGIFAVVYKLLFASGAGSMELSIFAMRDTLCYRLLSPLTDRLCRLLPFISGYVWLVGIGIVDSLCMVPLQFALWLSTVPGALRRLPRLAPERILLHGMAAGGFLAYHLFAHTSSSQIYFALAAILALALLAVEPLDAWLGRGGMRRAAVGVLGAVAAFSTFCTVAYHGTQAVRQLGSTTGLGPVIVTDRDLTGADENAMRWLRANAAPGAVFATNRTSSTPDLLDSISNGYSALSECQGYMEGSTYAMTNMAVDRDVIGHRYWINDRLFAPDAPLDEVRRLCEEEGIRYLVLAKRWPGGVCPDLAPVYENPEVAIYDVTT